MEQLPLGVRLRAASTMASFHAGPNAGVLAALEARADATGLSPVWLFGSPGAGRTHLLQATCALAGARGRRVGYLPLGDLPGMSGMAAGFEDLEVVCLDDVDRIAGDAAWEGALFTLYNGLLERGGNLVMSAAAAPRATAIRLPDLASRLAASIVFQLQPLAEADQGEALVGRARALGIDLPEDTLQYLQRRLPRDLATLCDALDKLDAAALSAQRRLTVPFVRSVLQLGAE